MYICSCNALTDSDVDRAIAAGASRPREVYAACGSQVQCGRCVNTIVTLLREAETEPEMLEALAA
ncbi:MAG: (2Fe-2S)-binding protein [Rhodospirillales bacterium]|nr:(2Fe-2S)-binding protein [Acetobacter sp.]